MKFTNQSINQSIKARSQSNEWMNKLMNEWINYQINYQTQEWMNGNRNGVTTVNAGGMHKLEGKVL